MSNEQSAYDGYEQQYQLITTPMRINSILRSLIDNHALLTVSIGDSTDIFSSVLLDADIDSNQLVLDAFHPDRGNTLLNESQPVIIQAKLSGIDVRFSTDIQSSNIEESSLSHIFNIPEVIRYRQRRDAYRAQVSPSYELGVKLTSESGSQCNGILFDISAGGVCIQFPQEQKLTDDILQQETRCSIRLPDRSLIRCQFKVTHSGKHEISGTFHVGGKFINLDKAQRRAIERFVAKLQRDLRQNLKR